MGWRARRYLVNSRFLTSPTGNRRRARLTATPHLHLSAQSLIGVRLEDRQADAVLDLRGKEVVLVRHLAQLGVDLLEVLGRSANGSGLSIKASINPSEPTERFSINGCSPLTVALTEFSPAPIPVTSRGAWPRSCSKNPGQVCRRHDLEE
jgi:hypothetical protein